MTHKEFEVILHNLIEDEKQMVLTKGKEYTIGSDDRLANFKRVAERSGLTPLQVWLVYFLKHIDSICSYVKEGKVFSDETIRGRFVDARTYLGLGWGIIEEKPNEI